MILKPNEVYITEKQLRAPDTILRYPDLIVEGVTYRQVRALVKGGVICTVKKEDKK